MPHLPFLLHIKCNKINRLYFTASFAAAGFYLWCCLKCKVWKTNQIKSFFSFFGTLSAPLNKCQWATFEDQIISTYLTLCYFIKEFFNFQMIALKST